MPNVKFVSLVIFELLAFNAQKFKDLRGHVTLATPPFRKNFSGVMSGLSLGVSVPNLKFVPSTVLKLLAFNAPNFTATPPFTLV